MITISWNKYDSLILEKEVNASWRTDDRPVVADQRRLAGIQSGFVYLPGALPRRHRQRLHSTRRGHEQVRPPNTSSKRSFIHKKKKKVSITWLTSSVLPPAHVEPNGWPATSWTTLWMTTLWYCACWRVATSSAPTWWSASRCWDATPTSTWRPAWSSSDSRATWCVKRHKNTHSRGVQTRKWKKIRQLPCHVSATRCQRFSCFHEAEATFSQHTPRTQEILEASHHHHHMTTWEPSLVWRIITQHLECLHAE